MANGVCLAASIRYSEESVTEPCEGPIGYRHAIAKRHLKLIADANGEIRANKDIETSAIWPEQYDELQPLHISRFSAGRWSCQRHDERFGGIDAEQIDLSDPECLFKAVHRVVLRQCHLKTARWSAYCAATQSTDSWETFKATAFESPVDDEEAIVAERKWQEETHALLWKMHDLEQRLKLRDWNSLDFRAILVAASTPAVAGWGCMPMRFDLRGLQVDDPRRLWNDHIEFGYMVVIPQPEGHAIITACEQDTRFRIREIVRIHRFMPERINPNEPLTAEARLKRGLSQKIWELNELGICESLYQSWPESERNKVQNWMKKRWSLDPMLLSQVKQDLPGIL